VYWIRWFENFVMFLLVRENVAGNTGNGFSHAECRRCGREGCVCVHASARVWCFLDFEMSAGMQEI